ncbi:MAG TPA: DUF5696 domain-containing protein [Phycisphaerae bacterium]|nr:DUF5696 domain-containing protein [Phycisphaerae bacterium]
MRSVDYLVLGVGLCALALSSSAAVGNETTLTLSNQHLSLDIDLRLDGGHVGLKDLKTNQLYEAADFGIVRVYDSTEDRTRVLIISPDVEAFTCKVTIDRLTDTQAVIRLSTGAGSASAMGTQSFGISLDVELTLKDNALEYAIPIASLKENLPQRWRLMNVEIFPHLGATPAGSPGYLLIPSWSGAVYYFDRNHPRANPQYTQPGHGDPTTESGLRTRWSFRPDAPAEYGTMMYGLQAAWEDQSQQPVYATIRDGAGLAGILLGGEYDTEIRARRDQGPNRTCSINPIWHYRRYWHSKLDPVDRRVRLVALGPDQANYSGVGNLLRDYLIGEKGVKTLRRRAETNEEVKYFVDSIYLRVMMGMKRFSLDGQGEMRSFQSWDQFREAIPLFQQAGFEKINFVFVGANFAGHDGAHPTVFPLEPAHGGEPAFRRMMERLNAAGYRACFHLNYKDVYQCSPDWTPQAIQVNEWGELRYHGAWIGGFSYQGIPQEMLERFGKRDLPRLRELGLRGMHYWDACLSVMEETFPARSGVPNNRIITRREYGEGAIEYFRYAAEIFGTVGCETSIVPLLGIIVNAGNTTYPGDGASRKFPGNGFCEAGLIDHWVPMQHVVYHGLCCYGGGAELAGRTGYEFNAAPTREEIDKIRKEYLETQQWNGPLVYEFITDHHMLAPGVFRTTLSDGTKIYVNKTGQDWTGEGVTVTAKKHLIRHPR